MSITLSNLRIIPYGQKDTLKPVFGDTMKLAFRLPDHEAGDKYTLALDYERILLPTMRPLCAMATEYTAEGTDVSFELEINTERFAQWVSGLKKPTPIWLQLVRVRGEEYTTILLDDILALPSVVDGANMVFPGTPLEDVLRGKADLVDGKVPSSQLPPCFEQQQADWDESDSSEPSYIKNKPTDFGSQQATDEEIDARQSQTHAITPNNLDYATRSVLPNVTTIPAATTAYSLLDASATTNNHSWQYFHAPASASTYVFPAVTDDSVAHRIKLTIDFTAVQTYSFEDSEGTAITPLFTPTISAGDVYEFDCEYSAVKGAWLIWPHKQGEVSDDYVMQSQVGAANGVAGLDSNALVPRANLPYLAWNTSGVNAAGAVKLKSATADTGLTISNGFLTIRAADERFIGERGNNIMPITVRYLNTAVTAALTDANKLSLTASQKASAQDTIGAYGTLHLDAAPTTSTVGAFGQRAIVDATGKAYTCQGATNTGTEAEPVWSYTWVDDVNAKGGTFTGEIKVLGSNTNWQTRCNGYSVVIGDHNTYNNGWCCLFAGSYLDNFEQTNVSLLGAYNLYPRDMYLAVGSGVSTSARSNGLEFCKNGDLYIAGGHQQGITAIPPATTAYTLTEGVQSHIPSSASTYTLPAIPQRVIADGRYFTRNTSTDGTGYYGWLSGTTNRYTASATPAVGDNTYTNTALTQGASPITAIDNRTHECILTVRFSSSVLTYAFEDASGNPLTPLPLSGTIQDGSVVAFRCTWEALLGQWVIEPKLLNPNA